MKKNLSIILSLLALVGVVVLAVVMACLNVSLSNVSLDTFIGVMVTMIGILVTFAVGWQIINALEIKSKLAEIEKIKADVNTQQSNIDKIAARIAYDTAVNRSYTLLYNLQVFASHSHTMHCYKSDSEAMAKADDAIKKSPKYPLIKDKYEEAIKEYNKWWKLVIDDIKNDDASRC